MNNDDHVEAKRTSGIQDRLGLRLGEFGRLTGLSLRTVHRRIRDGQINVVHFGDVPIITKRELERLGLIAS